jgi:hypothetical protein
MTTGSNPRVQPFIVILTAFLSFVLNCACRGCHTSIPAIVSEAIMEFEPHSHQEMLEVNMERGMVSYAYGFKCGLS